MEGYNNEHVYTWIDANDPLWRLVDKLVKEQLPDYWNRLMSIPIPGRRYFYCFPINAVNIDCEVPPHRDDTDDENGICCAIPFGDYEYGGGRLQLHDINMSIDDYVGDMIGFQGYNLTHSVSKYVGKQFACVLTSHDPMYFPPDPTRPGKNTVVKNGYKQQLNNN